jgi:hypothetical protein
MIIDQTNDTWVVVKNDDGFRVFSPLTPANQFLVKDTGEDITCTCRDYQQHADDPEWCCKHILAVLEKMPKFTPHQKRTSAPDSRSANEDAVGETNPASLQVSNLSQMLIKRSISPDGRIDSLSVEFSLPVAKITSDEIKKHAESALKLQGDIVETFRKRNGSSYENGNGAHAVSAQFLNIGAMDTKRGRSLFINVFVGNQITKLFGERKELSDVLVAAGYPELATKVGEGLSLNLPCRVVTKQNGKYLNIDRVLPAQQG